LGVANFCFASFASFPGPILLCSFLMLRLFILAVLEFGAPRSSFLEGVLYKYLIRMNEL